MKALLLSVLMLNAPFFKEKPKEEHYQLAEILDPNQCFVVSWVESSCAVVNHKLPFADCPFRVIIDRSKPECREKMTVQPVKEPVKLKQPCKD